MITILNAYTLSECMELMAQYVAEYEKSGGKNIIFCDDRLTLIAERALLREMGGTFDSYITTFSKFLKTDKKILSKQGAIMATGSIMNELNRENKLLCFCTPETVKSGTKSVYETMSQLAASAVDADTLQDSIANLEEGILKNKLSDVLAVYKKYDEFLQERGYIDSGRYLSLLPDYIRNDDRTKNRNLFFLCYNTFTTQELKSVEAAAERGENVVGIFCSGESEFYTNRAAQQFLLACEKIEKVTIINAGKEIGGEAEELRKTLFDPEALSEERMQNKYPTDNIHIFEANDKNEEAEYVAVKIRKFLANNTEARYRDIAVLLPDIKSYSLSVRRAFEEYNIPYFIDEKKSLLYHPLARFILDAFFVVRDGYSEKSVLSFTSNYFFGKYDGYRNYLMKFAAYRGGAKKEIKKGDIVKNYNRDELVSGRKHLLELTESIKLQATGKEYCNAVRKIIESSKAEQKNKNLTDKIEDVAQKNYLSRIFDGLLVVLTEAEELTKNMLMSSLEFEAVLTNGLDAAETSLIPLKTDAVFIGDITDSRIEKVRVLFAVGLTDAVPKTAEDIALVSDKEIEKLIEVKTRIEPTVAEINLRSRECVALNLCTFLDKLYLTYSLSGGDEPALSDVFRYIKIFRHVNGEDIRVEKEYTKEDYKYLCSAPMPAVRRMIIEKKYSNNDNEESENNYSTLYNALQKAGISARDDFDEEKSPVYIQKGKELFLKNGNVSPTTLEKYFTCPFSCFIEKGLNLKNREETIVLAMDFGNFIHELLEICAKKFDVMDNENDMRELALAEGEELLKQPVYFVQNDTNAGKYASDRLLKEGANVVVAAFQQVKGSDYKVVETEKRVSTSVFYGKIDRVDETDKYVRVIDYKTGMIDDSAREYYMGVKLQLQLYISAVKNDKIPAGVFYFPASESYHKKSENAFQLKGYLNGDEAAIRSGDKNLVEGEESNYFDAKLGDNSKRDKVMDSETFSSFLEYASLEANQGSEEMKKGFIAPTPIENCDHCKYGGICGFNFEFMPARKKESIKAKEIAEISKTVGGQNI